MSACPINHMLGIAPDIAHSRTCHNQYNHTPQSHDYPTCVESLQMSKHCHHHKYQTKPHSKEFIDNKHELMMKDCYSYNHAGQNVTCSNQRAESQDISLPE